MPCTVRRPQSPHKARASYKRTGPAAQKAAGPEYCDQPRIRRRSPLDSHAELNRPWPLRLFRNYVAERRTVDVVAEATGDPAMPVQAVEAIRTDLEPNALKDRKPLDDREVFVQVRALASLLVHFRRIAFDVVSRRKPRLRSVRSHLRGIPCVEDVIPARVSEHHVAAADVASPRHVQSTVREVADSTGDADRKSTAGRDREAIDILLNARNRPSAQHVLAEEAGPAPPLAGPEREIVGVVEDCAVGRVVAVNPLVEPAVVRVPRVAAECTRCPSRHPPIALQPSSARGTRGHWNSAWSP